MRLKNRLSPYPILDDFGDDYIDSSFTANYEIVAEFSQIYGKISFQLNNSEIQKLIEEDKAEYAVHIECPSTCYRIVKSSNKNEIEFNLDETKVCKVLEIRTFVVLKEDINAFGSEKFHPDYQGQKFDLKAHQILAVGKAENYDVKKDERDLDSFPSIIRIEKLKSSRKGSLRVNTDNDGYILIGLSEEVYSLYARLGKNIFRATAFSLVLLPAMVIVLQRMCTNKDDMDMPTMHWYQVIEKMLTDNGYSIDGLSADDDTLLSVCQSLFADPIARSFKELDTNVERM